MWYVATTGLPGSTSSVVSADNGVLSLYNPGDRVFETPTEDRKNSGSSSPPTSSPVTVEIGDTFRLSAVGGKLSAYTYFTITGDIGTETIAFHSSCSVPILIGDR